MPVTLKTIAREVGVSAMAVSSVLNRRGSTRVSEATRERILEAARRLEYRPNLGARGLRRQRTNLFGVLVWRLSDPLTGGMLSGIDEALSGTGFGILAASYSSLETLTEKVNLMLARNVDAVVLPGERHPEYLAEFARLTQGRPALCMGSMAPECGLPWVSTDKAKAAELAFGHLHGLGHRRWLLLSERPGFTAVLAALAEAAGDQVLWLRQASGSQEQGIAIGKALAANQYNATAVVAYNDENAAGVIRGLLLGGRKVPQEFSVLGYNNTDFARLSTPSLTTIENPGPEIGRQAVRVLQQMLSGQKPPSLTTVPPRLIQRESTGIAP